ncbi:right-handed parallel beta-helix repeat-containing protein [Phaeodactylibacter xiamenensis]|uniref:right-handed parallel beta-helix repeat-containing protein n=1 Tax=Phaeodactylibacter xiamenensis TaxID=1524460 RepID=UPI0024A8EBFA|nr:right-handed parallel beta-helix repeat-containing protein [Phaeodactylibacter xiamenensis]
MHIFQTEDPANPLHFTENHIEIINLLFDGANHHLANLCDDPDDFSPHMPDARIRLLNTGTIGEDVFFYQDDHAWGFGTAGCDYDILDLQGRYDDARDLALANYPDPDEEAFHIILTGGAWRDEDGDGKYDVGECHFPCGGGLTTNMGSCPDSGTPLSMGLAGTYGTYLSAIGDTGGLPDCGYEGEVADIGRGFLGEIFHVLSLDHLSPLQVHKNHSIGTDGCLDTPLKANLNLLDCNFTERCALTECQIGRLHRLFAEGKFSSIERFPDGNGGFSKEVICTCTEPTIVIPSGADVVWEGPKILRSGIVVEDGGKLTIKCEVKLPSDAKIEVEEGGALIIDGGHLLPKCEDMSWRGITLSGDGGPFVPGQSTYLRINPGSIIEAAENPIVNNSATVLAFGALISNSGTVALHDHENDPLTRFINCDFIRDSDYALLASPTENWDNQMLIDNFSGPQITGCTFNTIAHPIGKSNGMGIAYIGGRFTLSNSLIEGYRVGVNGNTLLENTAGRFTIQQCTLRNNAIAIVSDGVNNIDIRENRIEGIGNYHNGDEEGIVLRECTGFEVQDNEFEGLAGATDTWGIVVENSGSESNDIERNAFSNLHVANQAQLLNKGFESFVGLQYSCNTNTSNTTNDYVVTNEGIAAFQGSPTLPAGNTFSGISSAGGDFFNDSNNGITYHYFNGAADEEPVNTLGTFSKIPIDFENTCQPDDTDGPIIIIDPSKMRERYLKAREGYYAAKAEYDSLMNGGQDEAYWKSRAEGLTPAGAAAFWQNAVSISPYLSKGSLESIIKRGDLFSDAELASLLIANPEALREGQFQGFLYSELPAAMVDTILPYREVSTPRTGLEVEMAGHRYTMHQTANVRIKQILADTTGIDYTAYREWLRNKESLEAYYELATSYCVKDSFEVALEKCDSVPLLFELTEAQEKAHERFAEYLKFTMDAQAAGVHYAAYDSSRVAALQSIADSGDDRAAAFARSLLNTFYGYDYRIVPQSPNVQGLYTLPGSGPATQPQERAQPLSALPNPARAQVAFRYRLPDPQQPAQLLIYDMQGKLTATLDCGLGTRQQIWRTAGQQRGLYYCILQQSEYRSPVLKVLLID